MEKVKVWSGSKPEDCDICNFKIESFFVDGATKMGPWAIMCLLCHDEVGRGLGIGRGQKYRREGTQWTKIGG